MPTLALVLAASALVIALCWVALGLAIELIAGLGDIPEEE